jgi:hypothetical protein
MGESSVLGMCFFSLSRKFLFGIILFRTDHSLPAPSMQLVFHSVAFGAGGSESWTNSSIATTPPPSFAKPTREDKGATAPTEPDSKMRISFLLN